MAGVPVEQLGLQELNSVKEQLEGELKQLNASLGQLTVAGNKFGFSEDSVKAICPENAGKPIIMPLTSSLYIAGEVGDISKVMVDVGTGYYIEKSPAAAVDFLQRKQADLKKKCDALRDAIAVKTNNMQAVVMIMQERLLAAGMQQQQQQQQQQAAGGASGD
jgi:prefoldin alpha subunit